MASTELGVLRHKDFRWFFLTISVNRIGGMMTPVALAFAVLHIDNSAKSLSQVLAAQVVANVLCALFGGVIADRFSRRTVLQTTYLVQACVMGTSAALLFTDHATVASFAVLGALAGGAGAFAMPAIQGLVPQLVPKSDLQQANALMSFVRNGAQFLGPVLGTLLVATVGPQWALAIDACSFLIASALLLPVRLPPVMRGGSSIVHELREGWTEFRSRTWLWVIVLAFGGMNAIHGGAVVVLGPLVAKNTESLGIRGWGWVLGAEAVGMLLMSVVLLRVRIHHPLRAGMIGIALIGPFVIAIGVHPVTIPLMVFALVAGAGTETFGTGWNVALGEKIPSHVLSRVSSYDMVGSFVAIPIGMIVFGWLSTQISLKPLLIGSGIVYIVIALSTLAVPAVRNMTRDAESEKATPATP